MAKRLFDLVVSIISLIVLLLLFLIVAILIKLDSPGPVFYKGERIGKGGKPFQQYKFRTMIDSAENLGPPLTHAGDTRITRVGRILRKWKVDELPQVFNILKGEMSVVGPRPEGPRWVKYYTPEQRKVFQVRPGMAGLAQIKFRYEESLLNRSRNFEEDYIKEIMPKKLALDLEYIENQSLLLDVKLFIRMFLSLFHADEVIESE